ncbi:MAG: wax ester/triacylglycerol synthase family O-acyltransferase [Myxococcota bacterium]|nr:wax ester/triacylglycerol synthase family O-acyltransferase [Myxococcota bacterium]
MKPLSGLDATFLYAETERTPMNVLATLVVEGPVDDESLIERVASRLPDLPAFRRRLAELPFRMGHPVWIEDPDLDLRSHVRRIQAPAPGDDAALERVVSGIARLRLDRSRPLFEIVVIDGLEHGRTGLVVKAHHAAMDGVSGAAALLHLFDRAGEASASSDFGPRSEARLPDAASLFGEGLARLREVPARCGRAAREAGSAARELARDALAADAPLRDAALPFQAPTTELGGPLSTRRVVAYARTEVGGIQAVRDAFGGTMNDVVLAACTRALQGELLERGELPREPLVAAVPVSTRSLDDPADCGNRISAFLTHLPVHVDDPLHQLSEVRRATRAAKRFHSSMGAGTLASLAELLPPGMASRAFDWYGRLGLVRAHRPLCNVVISNVPGPPEPLSLFGRTVHALHPHGPLMDGVGVNITVMSYAGSLDVGVLACPERLSDACRLADRVGTAMEELIKLAEAALPDVPPIARIIA